MIEIDPNVRVAHNHTFTFAPAEAVEDYAAGDAIVVVEPESGQAWPATITILRQSPRGDFYVELDVAWAKGKTMPRAARHG